MSKHTPEPWKKLVYKDGVCFVMAGGYARGTAPASPVTPCIACLDGAVLGFGYEQNEANGDRIVACVNALAGIPDPAAYLKERADYIERLEAELAQARADARVLAAEVSQWREKSRVNEAWKGDRLILSRLYRGEFLSTSFEKAMRTTNASGALERNKP